MSQENPAAQAQCRPGVKGMARVTQVSLFQREVRERLSTVGLDILLSKAKVISEGQVMTQGGSKRYYGSTMLTVDVAASRGQVRDPLDAATTLRLADMLRGDPRARKRLRLLAGAEVERLCGKPPLRLEMELSVEAKGETLLVDLDVEAELIEGTQQIPFRFTDDR